MCHPLEERTWESLREEEPARESAGDEAAEPTEALEEESEPRDPRLYVPPADD